MGWSGGSSMMAKIIKTLKPVIVDDKERTKVYRKLKNIFENDGDCDTLYECKGLDPAFDKVLPKGDYE
jgi:hypothetical protein